MRKKKKSKILIILIIIVVLVLAGKACGGSKDTDTSVDDSAATNQEVSDSDTADSDDAESSEDASEPESADDKSSDDKSSDDESSDSDSSVISPEFKKTMDDYEAWFDHYCEVMKKYEDNPSDLELMSEMTDLLAEEGKMLEQLENMDESEMNTAEYAYYIEVTARIEKKLLEVSG